MISFKDAIKVGIGLAIGGFIVQLVGFAISVAAQLLVR